MKDKEFKKQLAEKEAKVIQSLPSESIEDQDTDSYYTEKFNDLIHPDDM